MKNTAKGQLIIHYVCFFLIGFFLSDNAYGYETDSSISGKVQSFLENEKGKWRDMNVPAADGQVLYDLIIENGYKRAVEVGTSTGHSAIWIAWALSKTGGKLITIEIDDRRYKKALDNFKKAGLIDYIDARLADAHDLVPQLEGPIDFVFVDADKDWYTKYFKSLVPKLEVGGCYTAHNVLNFRNMQGIREFLDYVQSLPYMETTIDRTSSSGISISYKKAAQ